MYTTEELLTLLLNYYSLEERASLLARLIRSPFAFQTLKTPEVFSTVINSSDSVTLGPADVVRSILDVPVGDGEVLNLPAEFLEESSKLLEAWLDDPVHQMDAIEFAGICVALANIDTSEFLNIFIPLLQNRPIEASNMLACSWSFLSDRSEIVQMMAKEEGLATTFAIINALLANEVVEESINVLLGSVPTYSRNLINNLELLGQDAFLVELLRNAADNPSWKEDIDGEHLLPVQAFVQMKREGDANSSIELLEQAWDEAARMRAGIADELALAHFALGDRQTSLQALKRAHEIEPTTRRQNRIAISYMEDKESSEAIKWLGEDSGDEITRLLQQIIINEQPSDFKSLISPYFNVPEFSEGDVWLQRLQSVAKDSGQAHIELSICELRITQLPSSDTVRRAYAEALLQAGYVNRASDEATLSLALNPDSAENLLLSAEIMMRQHKYDTALPLLRSVYRLAGIGIRGLIECAINTGDISVARDAVQQLNDSDELEISSQVFSAKILVAENEIEKAKALLQTLVEQHPLQEDAWLALDSVQSNDHEEAISTLRKASGALPGSAAIAAQLTRRLFGAGRYREAFDQSSILLELAPDTVTSFQLHSRALAELGKSEEARLWLEKVLVANPGNIEARLQLTKMQLDESREVVDSVLIDELPEHANASEYFQAGRLLLEIDEGIPLSEVSLQSALDYLEISQSENVASPDLLYWLAKVYERTENLSDSLDTYKAFLQLERDHGPSDLHAKALLGIGCVSIRSGNFDLARSVLEEAVSELEQPAGAYVQLSQAYTSLNLMDEALEAAKAALDQDPDNLDALTQIIRISSEHDQESALEATGHLLALEPDDPEILLSAAELYAAAGRNSEARNLLAGTLWNKRSDKALIEHVADSACVIGESGTAYRIMKYVVRNHPTPTALHKLASLAEQVKELDAAEDAHRQLTLLEPDRKSNFIKLAQTLWLLNKHDDSIIVWKSAVELCPEDPSIQASLARALLATGQEEESLERYSLAIEDSEREPSFLLEAAQVAISLQKNESATRWLERAQQIDPDLFNAHYELCQLYLDTGKITEAERQLSLAAEAQGTGAEHAALAAKISIFRGDYVGAQAILESAWEEPELNLPQQMLLLQAMADTGNWRGIQIGLEKLKSTKSPGDPILINSIQSLQVRMLEVRWLLSDVFQIQNRGPDPHFSPDDTKIIDPILSIRAQLASNPENQQLVTELEAEIDHSAVEEDIEALAMAYLQGSDSKRALSILDKKPGSDRGGWGKLLASLAEFENNEFQESINRLNSENYWASSTPMQFVLRARAEEKLGMLPQAIQSWEQALTAWPDEPFWQFHLGRLLLDDGSADGLTVLYRAVEADESNIEFRSTLVEGLMTFGDLQEARRNLEIILGQRPNDIAANEAAGFLYLQEGDSQSAVKHLQLVLKAKPNAIEVIIATARAERIQGNFRQAALLLKRALEIESNSIEAQVELARLQVGKGKFDEAQRTLQKVIDQSPENIPAQQELVSIWLDAGEPMKAVQIAESAVKRDSTNPFLWASLTEALVEAEVHEEARIAMDQAIRFSGDDVPLRIKLSGICQQTGQLDQALGLLDIRSANAASNWELDYQRARILSERRQLEAALTAYRNASTLNPSNAAIHFEMGKVLKRMKAYPEAGRSFEQAIQLEPQNTEAMHQLAAVRALELVHTGLGKVATLG